WVIGFHTEWDDCATGLQVTPLQRTVDAVEDEDHALLRSLDPHFHEALEEGCAVEIEDAGKRLNADAPTPNRFQSARTNFFKFAKTSGGGGGTGGGGGSGHGGANRKTRDRIVRRQGERRRAPGG